MILEHAVLQVVPGQEHAFENAFEQAKAIIAGSPGFRSLRLGRCVDHEHRYLLLVEWASLDDHTIGFRRGPRYEEWRTLLHDFYEPFPGVDHFEDIVTIP